MRGEVYGPRHSSYLPGNSTSLPTWLLGLWARALCRLYLFHLKLNDQCPLRRLSGAARQGGCRGLSRVERAGLCCRVWRRNEATGDIETADSEAAHLHPLTEVSTQVRSVQPIRPV